MLHMSSAFQYSNEVINHKNPKQDKCVRPERITKCSASMYLNGPLHRAVHIQTSWDQDDA